MEQAAKDLKKNDPKAAGTKQDSAINKLKKAIEELEKALAQLRKDQQEEILAALEARFAEMLQRQRIVTTATLAIDTARAKTPLGRAEQLRLAELSTEEKVLEEMGIKALTIIKADATTVVFPYVVEQLVSDLNRASSLLQQHRTDIITHRLQKNIEQTLEELIDALKKAQQEQQSKTSKPRERKPDQPKPDPLVPPAAELKLLKAAQLRVNRRTQAIQDVSAKQGLDPVIKQEMADTAVNQAQVAKMAQDMIERN
jgi:hypothetical protein